MMVLTHIAAGGAVAGAFSLELAAAGMIGGLVPDLDLMLSQHRRTLHFPYYYTAALGSAAAAAALTSSLAWWSAAAFFSGAAIHSWMDALGGGLERRPWKETDDRGVYDHLNDRWIETRHWVYDGSPGDLALLLAASLYMAHVGVDRRVVLGLVLAGLLYSAIRKKLLWVDEKLMPGAQKPSEDLRDAFGRAIHQVKSKLPLG